MFAKVKTRKQLEDQGIARIESNDAWGYGEPGEFKYVLNIIDNRFVFKHEGSTNYSHATIKDCIDHYNDGFVTRKEFYTNH